MSNAKIIEVNLSECYLRNTNLEKNPTNHKSSQFYQKVFESIKNKGIVNPLTVVKKKDKYEVCLGNNRYLAAKELGITKVKVLIVPNNEVKTLKNSYHFYQNIESFIHHSPKKNNIT